MVVVVAVIVMAGKSVRMVHAVPFTQVLVVEAVGCAKGRTGVWRMGPHHLQAGTRIAAVIYGDGRQVY